MKIGSRVGAVSHTDDTSLYLFGYGVYEGEFVPEEGVGGFGELCREAKRPNPRIRLDDGKAVYGCECWWSAEEEMKKTVKKAQSQGMTVVQVDIDEARKAAAASEVLDGEED